MLSVSYLTNMIQTTIPSELCDQYKIHSENEFADLLLSPRSQIKDNMYMSCEQCHRNIKHSKTNNPPKFAISNGWCIGELPNSIIDGEISDILESSVAKFRIFANVWDIYIFLCSYSCKYQYFIWCTTILIFEIVKILFLV